MVGKPLGIAAFPSYSSNFVLMARYAVGNWFRFHFEAWAGLFISQSTFKVSGQHSELPRHATEPE